MTYGGAQYFSDPYFFFSLDSHEGDKAKKAEAGDEDPGKYLVELGELVFLFVKIGYLQIDKAEERRLIECQTGKRLIIIDLLYVRGRGSSILIQRVYGGAK